MFYWIYEVPTLVVVALFGAFFVAFCWVGIFLFRPHVKDALHQHQHLNEILANFLHYFGVLYGLLLGLLAIATYQDFADAEKEVANEASSLAALYRDIGAYPEPNRTALQNELREYTRDVIDTSWSLQHRGFVPLEAEKPVAAFQLLLVQFHPQDKSQELLHEETLRQFNNFYAYRRSRLYSVTSGIPAVLWYTIALGALINIVLIWLFDLRLRPHLILGGLVSFYLATVISVIALLDHPFRGDLGVSSEAFELVYNQLMKQ